jgi:hypothetical protein
VREGGFLAPHHPLTLKDAFISNMRDRAVHARHWKQEYEERRADVAEGLIGPTDLALWWRIGRWVSDVGEMLAHISDKLHPHGFESIVANEFVSVKDLLERRI